MNTGLKTILQEGCPEVRIPDTVVYKGGFPANWYFHSKVDGRLLKKKPESLYIPKIFEAFGAENGTCDTQVLCRIECSPVSLLHRWILWNISSLLPV